MCVKLLWAGSGDAATHLITSQASRLTRGLIQTAGSQFATAQLRPSSASLGHQGCSRALQYRARAHRSRHPRARRLSLHRTCSRPRCFFALDPCRPFERTHSRRGRACIFPGGADRCQSAGGPRSCRAHAARRRRAQEC